MKRIEEYAKEIAVKASDYLHRRTGPGVLQLCGCSGMGKTLLAKHYCKEHNGLYFSFRNLDAAFAPRIFISGCNDWESFFSVVPSIKNRPVIFFDDMDERDDKDIFFEMLPMLAGFAYVVLIYRREVDLPMKSDVLEMKPMDPAMLRRRNKKLKPLDALRIIAVTDGIPALVNQFDLESSFAGNIRKIFVDGSPYLRYAPEQLRHEFRSPETYNTLLYGLALGYNRISQLSEFSGFPKNKCDKYLKALDAAGFLETKQKKDKTGKLRTNYYPKGGYFRAWYQLYFPRQEKFFEPLDDDTVLELLLEIDEYIAPYYFRECCWKWLSIFSDELSWEWRSRPKDPIKFDVTINGVHFDFVQQGKDRNVYVKIIDGVDEVLSLEMFQKIEATTTKTRPFYSNMYYLFSIQPADPSLQRKQDLDNVVLVDAEKFFTRDCIQFFGKAR